MYKTIRHGENSLQYTILPQNDDFRMDGKLSSNCSSNSNTNNHKSKRGRRRSFFAYLGLLFVCTVIIGAILIPFLVSAECLPNPSDWFIRTKLINEHEKSINQNNNNNNNQTSQLSKLTNIINNINFNVNNKTDSTIKSHLDVNQNIPSTEILSTAKSDDDIITSDQKIYTNPMQSDKDNMIKTLQQKYSTDHFGYNIIPTQINTINDDGIRSTDGLEDVGKIVNPTSSTPKLINLNINNNNNNKDITINNNFELQSTQMPSTTTIKLTSTTTTSSMPPLSTSSKKPIILPVLAKTNSVIRENGKPVDRPAEPKNWIRSHWPFIDPSTYFQWAGYKSEDSVLLPAILGVALIGMILIITLCSVARNKKTIVASVRKRNRNDVEEAGEDNTTLLTTGYISDED